MMQAGQVEQANEKIPADENGSELPLYPAEFRNPKGA
jgi:hypothetical protein